ncbi:uncharacterized protein LOC124350134 [Daphnia pulicaria]|uniref:uncharacterized protein LOC124350134 n=1 Tax=Daphnia pulicaria TaxID=35523 RepID=UPI001EEB90D8|nr:uncharacterized protein LOC124350134 [Daphnia pulicaria]
MGQKQSSSEVTDSEMAMTNRTDLSSQFTNVMSRSYQTDECFNCGAALEDSNLYNSSTTSSRTPKSSTELTVRCRQCRVCDSTNVILEKFRAVITSSPRSIPIVSSAHNESNQFSQTNHHLMRTDMPNNATSTFTESSSTCV